jgi:hypothetical protein
MEYIGSISVSHMTMYRLKSIRYLLTWLFASTLIR